MGDLFGQAAHFRINLGGLLPQNDGYLKMGTLGST